VSDTAAIRIATVACGAGGAYTSDIGNRQIRAALGRPIPTWIETDSPQSS